MKCPKCTGNLSPWMWQDGGCKGVLCLSCNQKWWSDSFSKDADDVAQAAICNLIDLSFLFPKDAETDEAYKARMIAGS